MESESIALDTRVNNNIPETVLAKTPSGSVVIQAGDSGTWIRFDGDCKDMTPYCFGHCCSLIGIHCSDEDLIRLEKAYGEEEVKKLIDWDEIRETISLKRLSDGRCIAQNRADFSCAIYENRPDTCRDYHCTKGCSARGFKLPNYCERQNNY